MTRPASTGFRAPWFLIGGGTLLAGGAWWLWRRSGSHVDDVRAAVKSGGVFDVKLTGYWPFSARPDEVKMEGGTKDRRGNPLHTLEMHQRDPVAHPFVSVAGDYEIFPYGQRLEISVWPGLVFRVVDTGGHFHGAGKLYRVVGHEPLDICVDSSKTVVPHSGVTARIVAGDNFEGGKAVATSRMRDQTVAGEVFGEEIAEARAPADAAALARAIESELGGRPVREREVAAWAIRNRADYFGESVAAMLAPDGKFGPVRETGGYASTRKSTSASSRAIATRVLDAPQSADPTGGAIEFWVPENQDRMREFGDVYRAAVASGDEELARRYERYADYPSEEDVRAVFEQEGLRVIRVEGIVELLGWS